MIFNITTNSSLSLSLVRIILFNQSFHLAWNQATAWFMTSKLNIEVFDHEWRKRGWKKKKNTNKSRRYVITVYPAKDTQETTHPIFKRNPIFPNVRVMDVCKCNQLAIHRDPILSMFVTLAHTSIHNGEERSFCRPAPPIINLLRPLKGTNWLLVDRGTVTVRRGWFST